jgi:hypothetical protein
LVVARNEIHQLGKNRFATGMFHLREIECRIMTADRLQAHLGIDKSLIAPIFEYQQWRLSILNHNAWAAVKPDISFQIPEAIINV